MAAEEKEAYQCELRQLVREHEELRRDFAALKSDLLRERCQRKYGYDPNQLRDDDGRWADTQAATNRIRLAAAGKPPRGRAAAASLALEAALQAIKRFRSDNVLRDLLGKDQGTVATVTLGDTPIFGTSSGTPDFDEGDRAIAEEMRDLLVQKYPEVMKRDNLGQKPNDALFHAEATVLLRAARQNGGTLVGKNLEVFVDRPVCASSCQKVLPYLGKELGDPKVTFVDINGTRMTMQNGAWLK
jgi:hypothetical protein